MLTYWLKSEIGDRAVLIALGMLLMLAAPLTLRAQEAMPSPGDKTPVAETSTGAMVTAPELGVVTGGIYDHNTQSILTNGSQIFAEMRGMGAKWIRIQANWQNPSDGTWVPDNTYRGIVEQAHQNGLKVIVVVSGTYTGQVTESAERQWAQNFVCDNPQNNYNCTGDQRNKSLSYLANLVFTGPSHADAYEIINEPNMGDTGTPSGFRVGGTTFAWLLREVYLWKERNRRSELIISGGTLRTWWSAEWGWWGNLLQNWRAFRRNPDDPGTKFRPYDYFGVHPYNEQAIDQRSLEGCNGPYTPAVFNNWKTQTANTLSSLRTQLGDATGDYNSIFFATEFAFWLRDPNRYIPPCGGQGWDYWGMRDSTQQADALQAAYETFRDSGIVTAGLWHEYRDFTDAPSGALARIGLRSSFDGQRYPARQPTWSRFKTLAGGTGSSDPEAYWTQTNAPPIPTGLNATPNCNSITFRWNPTPGATGYYVDIANSMSDLVNQVGTFRNASAGGAASYTWSNLSSNTQYYWRIWAYNSYGTHGYPSPAFVYTSNCGGPPPAPTNLFAVPGCTSISLSWSASPGANGYYVDIANSDYDLRNMTGTFRNFYNGNSTSYTWAGLSSNANYYWRIWAFNDYGGNHGYPSPQYVTTGCGGFGVSYQAYVESRGWSNWVSNGLTAGTTGQSLRLEGLKVNLDNPPSGVGICYQAHVQNIGWQGQVCGNNQQIGAPGQGLRMEAVKIWLTNPGARHICYQTHVQNIGWQNEVCDGQTAGTTGQSLRIEAIKIRVTGSGLEPDKEVAPSVGPEAPANTPSTLSAQP